MDGFDPVSLAQSERERRFWSLGIRKRVATKLLVILSTVESWGNLSILYQDDRIRKSLLSKRMVQMAWFMKQKSEAHH